MTKTNKTNITSTAALVLKSMTREQVNGLANATGTKVGKSKIQTDNNLLAAIKSGKVGFKIESIFNVPIPGMPLDTTEQYRPNLFWKRISTYKADKVKFDIA